MIGDNFPKSSKAFLVLICLAIEIIALIVTNSLLRQQDGVDTIKATEVALIAIYALSIYIWCSYTKKIVSIYFIFMIACLLFNAGQVIIDLLGINIEVAYVNVFSVYQGSIIVKSLIFQSICVSSMLFGAILAFNKNVYSSQIAHKGQTPYDNRFLDIVYLLSAVILLILCAININRRNSLSYADYYEQGEGISTPLIFVYHLLMYRELVVRDKKDRFLTKVHIINILLIIAFLIVGSRSITVQIVVGYLFIYAYINKEKYKFTFKRFLTYFGLGMVALYILACFENLRDYSIAQISISTSLEIMGKGFISSIFESIASMGTTLRCIAQTISSVDTGAYSCENTIIYSLLKTFFPTKLLDLVGIIEPLRYSLSTWLTRIDGSRSGWGYSLFAEAYYNYKELGFVFFGFLGYLFVSLEQTAIKLIRRNEVILGCGIIYVLAYFIFMARGDTSLVFIRAKYLFFIYVFYLIKKNVLHTERIVLKIRK